MSKTLGMDSTDCDTDMDSLLIRSVEKLDSIIALRNELNQYMETGMIDLARARYATGGPRSTISSLSFNLGHMEASKRISCEPVSCELPSSGSAQNDNVLTRFHLQPPATQANRTLNHEEAQLRNRQVPSLGSSGSIQRDSLESDNDKSSSSLLDDRHSSNGNTSSVSGYSSDQSRRNSQSTNDPLRWFGILVPTSLRSSKQCFDRALEILAEIASQQNELSTMLDRFQKLRRNSGSLDKNLRDLKLSEQSKSVAVNDK
ncbi:coiled-coil domain-containing protein 115 [Galendromus occidentalis]|uniref:Vacuolar ATPase assembly protein VMA22 n=1 Tax=Galendromus occidentalis TaxID=34638 RepID=A0AAJ6QPA8_9ACAR|nr:coiled-coil domain-containing protein 115 [Galendromus occidentalis]